MANAKQQQNNSRGNNSPAQVWKDDEDSPIEQAKVHPFIKKSIQSSAFAMLLVAMWTCMYLFKVWEFEMDSMFDMFYLMFLFGPPVLILCFMHIVRTAKVRE